MSDEQEITGDFLNKPLPKGGDFGPMELLPEREWLRAKILEVKCIYAMFNGQIQYLSTKNEETDEEVFTLPKYLLNLSHPNAKEEGFNPTPNEVINFLVGKDVFVQFAMKVSKDPNKESKQNIVKEAIKLDLSGDDTVMRGSMSTPVSVKAPEKSPFGAFASQPNPAASQPATEPAWDD